MNMQKKNERGEGKRRYFLDNGKRSVAGVHHTLFQAELLFIPRIDYCPVVKWKILPVFRVSPVLDRSDVEMVTVYCVVAANWLCG